MKKAHSAGPVRICRVQGDEGQNMDGIAEFGGVFHRLIRPFHFFDVNFIITAH